MNSVLAAHQWLYRTSRGWLGHRLLGVPTLLLTTTGRRSGRPRTQALVYAASGDELAVVASWGGSDRNPAWYLNLVDDPSVVVQVKRVRAKYIARTVGGAERDIWWRRCNDANADRFDDYQAKTNREIPVVVLTPNGERSGS